MAGIDQQSSSFGPTLVGAAGYGAREHRASVRSYDAGTQRSLEPLIGTA